MIGSGYSRSMKVLQKLVGRIAIAAVVTFFLVGCLFTASEFYSLFSLTDSGYGDSYILYDILHFQKSGVIYRDLSLPPYLPAQYSPLVYVVYSIPGRIANFSNQFFGPRLIALAVFLLCVLIVISI